ncbi:MAG: AtpZ/AtpI family protein [Bacteroidales bacterium]|nr:AtpZ/AtpI family protein [Bacteroidales bacterium]
MQNKKKLRQKSSVNQRKKYIRDYARYSNFAFKLIAVILAAFFIGMKLDRWISLGFPLFTLLLSVGALTGTLFLLIKDLSSK